MVEDEKLKEPFFRGLLYLPLDELKQPLFIKNKYRVADGRCEIFVRENLEMPPIDALPEEMRYKIGIAMRYIACSFDVQGLEVGDAMKIYGLLAERIDDWMDQHFQNTAAFEIDTLLDLYVSLRPKLDNDYLSWFRGRVHVYIDNRLNAPPEIGPSPRAFDIEAVCEELFRLAPVLRIPSSVYDQCERADSIDGISAQMLAVPTQLFLLLVDGETRLQSVSDPSIRMQTKWLLVDVRGPRWECYERVHSYGPKGATLPDITYGAWYDTETGNYGPIESQMWVPVDGTPKTLSCNLKEAGRIFHALGTFMALYRHPRVRVRKSWWKRDPILTLPRGMSVNDLISDILKAS